VNVWRAKDGSRVAHILTLTTPGDRVMQFPRNESGPDEIQSSLASGPRVSPTCRRRRCRRASSGPSRRRTCRAGPALRYE
jgi:hypothetical protein